MINLHKLLKEFHNFPFYHLSFLGCLTFYPALAFDFARQRMIFHKYLKTDQEEESATTFQMLGYSGMPVDIFADTVA